MAQSSYPFENVDTTETQFSQMFRTLNAGVNGTPSGTELKVTAGTGLQVAVAAGQAMVRGHYYISTASENLTIGTANPSNPRIDSIVLTLDPTANSITLAVVAGTAASSPVAPTLTQTDGGVYQYQLATVLIPAAATSVSTITDTRSFMGDRFGVWSTAGRPTDGKFRAGYNTTTSAPEFYNGSTWVQLSSSAAVETLTNKTLSSPLFAAVARENVYLTGAAFSGFTFYATTNGAIQFSNSAATSNGTLNITSASGQTLDSIMSVGQSMTVTYLINNGATAYYPTAIQVDGASPAAIKYPFGNAFSAGNANSWDVYTFTIIKNSSASFWVLASQAKFA